MVAWHAFQHRTWNQRDSRAGNHTGQHAVVGLHFMDRAWHGTIGVKPAFKVATIGTVGAKGIDIVTIHIAGPFDGGGGHVG